MSDVPPAGRNQRRDRLIRERVHDPYKTRQKLPEPTVCPQCGAVYHAGRWQWAARPEGADEELCQACHRINDAYPAGIVAIEGRFVADHRREIEHLVRNTEADETNHHPLHRIISMEPRGGGLLVKTTDIHLPRRIGEAVQRAYNGELSFHYEDEAYFLRVHWRREA